MELNKIYNEDCLETMKRMPNNFVDLVLTDPPYGMDYQSAWRTASPKYEKITGDKDLSWFPDFAKQLYRILKDNSHIYIFCNDYAISEFRNELEKVGFTPKRTLVWVKNNHTSGDLEGDYGNKTEFCLYAQKGRKELNGKRNTNVLQFSRTNNTLHPTEKPLDMFSFLLRKSSVENDLIYDPFIGSGTTARVCKDMNRNYIGSEISEEYCEIIKKRLAQQTLI